MKSYQTPGTEPEPQQVQKEYPATLEEAVEQGYPLPPDALGERYPEAFQSTGTSDGYDRITAVVPCSLRSEEEIMGNSVIGDGEVAGIVEQIQRGSRSLIPPLKVQRRQNRDWQDRLIDEARQAKNAGREL